jgi:hypothetical protein
VESSDATETIQVTPGSRSFGEGYSLRNGAKLTVGRSLITDTISIREGEIIKHRTASDTIEYVIFDFTASNPTSSPVPEPDKQWLGFESNGFNETQADYLETPLVEPIEQQYYSGYARTDLAPGERLDGVVWFRPADGTREDEVVFRMKDPLLEGDGAFEICEWTLDTP